MAAHLFQTRHGAATVSAGTEGRFHIFLNQGQIVTRSQLVFQKQGGAHTTQLPMGNDGNSVPKDVSFVHVVCRQNNGAACQAQTQGDKETGRWDLSVLTDQSGTNGKDVTYEKDMGRSLTSIDVTPGWQGLGGWQFTIVTKRRAVFIWDPAPSSVLRSLQTFPLVMANMNKDMV
jgi:hypothetical protein